MEYATSWWVIAGTLVLLELMTGSFYLLMLALGAGVGALCAYSNVSPALQLVCAALSASAFVFVCYLLRRRKKTRAGEGNRDINLDIGETVNVERWDADGTAQVRYRGAQWTVVASDGQASPSTLYCGLHRIIQVNGSRLVVDKMRVDKIDAQT